MKIVTTLFLATNFFLCSNVSMAQYTYQKKEPEESKVSEFEVGFHFGPAWTSGDVKEYAQKGNSFSFDLGVNSGVFYLGTEFTITSWNDFKDSADAEDLNFQETNFLWLANAKLFLGEGKVKPYLGLGTDLISLGESIFTYEDDDCYYNCNDSDDESNYNAWIVPNFGVRWEMGPDVSGNVGFSMNASDNYTFLRLQLGIVF